MCAQQDPEMCVLLLPEDRRVMKLRLSTAESKLWLARRKSCSVQTVFLTDTAFSVQVSSYGVGLITGVLTRYDLKLGFCRSIGDVGRTDVV